MKDAIYIDTRADAPGMFANPCKIEEYDKYLQQSYDLSRNGYIIWGMAKKIDLIIYEAIYKDVELFALGPWAGQAARVVEFISKGTVEVKVLG